MTCIVGIEHGGGVIIGGDSAGTAGWHQTIRADQKVFTTGPYLMGYTGSPRIAQLLRYRLNVSAPDTWDVDRFIATTFTDAVRAALTNGGAAKVESNQETMDNSAFLVGVGGRLYAIYADYQFSRSVAGYLAVGCGDEIALGSLHTTAKMTMAPHKRVEHALEAAAAVSAGCAGPFTILDNPVKEMA